MIVARYSRYLIDLNRPPDDAALYGAAAQTGLCPALSFAGEPLYRDGTTQLARGGDRAAPRTVLAALPRCAGRAARRNAAAARLRDPARCALDPQRRAAPVRGHACRISTSAPTTADPARARVTEAVRACLAAAPRWSQVVDGRFKGGHITRHFGRPHEQVHALQIELAQSGYMDEGGIKYDPERAAPMRALLRAIIEALLQVQPHPA